MNDDNDIDLDASARDDEREPDWRAGCRGCGEPECGACFDAAADQVQANDETEDDQ